MDRLRALQYFQKIAETQSFARTAEYFGVQASTVSRRIQNLETSLGVELVYRNTRVVRLTELGTHYLEHIAPAIQTLALADQSVGGQSDEPSGSLRITSTPGYGSLFLLPAVNKLRNRYPKLCVDLDLSDHLKNLANNETDIAVRATAMPPDNTISHMLADNIYHLVGSPAYLSKHGRPRMVADLADHKALLYRRPQGVVQWQAKTGDTWGELTMQAAYTTNLGDILLEEACLGGGLALIPEWCAREQIKDGILEKVNLEDAQLFISRRTTSGIYLLCHRPKYSLSKIQLCVGFLLSELPDFQGGQQT